VIPIEVVFAKETLGSGDAGYGVLLASWGAGMLAGGILFAAVNRISLRTLLPISTLAVGLAYVATAASPTLLVACVASVIGGIGNGIQWVGLMTAVQHLTQRAFQARVISLLEALAKAMPGVGFLLGGALAAAFNPRVSYAVAGAGVIVVLIAASVGLLRTGWRGDEGPELEPATSRAGGETTPRA
jgi:MFS family permease